MLRAPFRRVRLAPGAFGKPQLPPSSRRGLVTGETENRGTWRGTALRWGLAGGAVYWYNTSPLFADDAPPLTSPAPSPFPEDTKTIDAVVAEKRKQIEARAQEREARDAAAAGKTKKPEQKAEKAEKADATEDTADQGPNGSKDEKLEALEEEAGQQAAFNPETGEINWDCPCLGGMAHGPCGEEFKSAFSCFVHSPEENKGIDCIDHFQAMQDCFRKHPDVYGEELEGSEEGGEGGGEEARGGETAVPKEDGTPVDPAGGRVRGSIPTNGTPTDDGAEKKSPESVP